MGKVYGYARVGSKEQSLNRQLDTLAAFGVAGEDTLANKVNRRDFERPERKLLISVFAEVPG